MKLCCYKVFLTLLVCVLTTAITQAQTPVPNHASGYVAAGPAITEAGTLGYLPHSLGIFFDADASPNSKLEICNRLNIARAKKVDTGDGMSTNERLRVRYLVTPAFFVSGGFNFTHQATSLWKKNTFNPALGVGCNFKTARTTVTPEFMYLFSDHVSVNHGKGINASLDIMQDIGQRYGIKTFVSFSHISFYQPWGILEGNRSGNVVTFGCGIYFRFGKTNTSQ